MKFLIPIILISILSLSFISKNTNTFQTDKNGLTVKEFISFFENRNNPDAVPSTIPQLPAGSNAKSSPRHAFKTRVGPVPAAAGQGQGRSGRHLEPTQLYSSLQATSN